MVGRSRERTKKTRSDCIEKSRRTRGSEERSSNVWDSNGRESDTKKG